MDDKILMSWFIRTLTLLEILNHKFPKEDQPSYEI